MRFVRLLLLSLCAGCGAEMDSAASDPDGGAWTPECFASNECPTGWSCSELGMCEPPPPVVGDAGVTPPPEVERELSPPSSALRYVYAAMTDLDALARIDGATLEVTAVPVGDRPEVVQTLPGSDDAVVLDRGSATATIVRPIATGDVRLSLPTLPGVNVLSPAPSGDYAVAWFDLTRAVQEAGTVGGALELGTLQDVTVLSLALGTEASVDLAVGFRPREIEYDDAGAVAFVITDDGVSRIDLAATFAGAPSFAAPIPVASDPLSDPEAIEVEVTGDGLWAVAREVGRPELRIVSLVDGAATVVPLPAPPTDVDLVGGRAFAVLRATSELAVVEVPAGTVELVALGGDPVGSLVASPAGDRGLLFTNAEDLERLLVVDFATGEVTVRPIEKGVRSIAFAPDGRTAIVLHSKRPGDPASAPTVDELVDRSHGYSIVDLDAGMVKVVLTTVAAGGVAFAPDGARAWIALDGGDSDGALRRVDIVDLVTFAVEPFDLGSPPETVGVLPSVGVAFVAQRHPLGRVTFLPMTGEGPARTVTGFELESHIVD